MRDQLLGGRYRLVRQLGEGGMGQVWEAQDETLDRPVAVKVISLLAGGGSRGGEARARFLREARITARLQHPNIVTIHDLGETGTGNERVPFLVMELIRGEGLDATLRRGVVTLPDAARWGAQIGDALAAAHNAGIMHRDIKPSNILITPSGTVKVLDFGIARAADPYATADRLTQTGFIVGTPPYMAPEQARGFPEPRSDLYALGCLLFELITGQLPFQAPDTVGYLTAHLTQAPPAPSSLSTNIPPAWDNLVLTLLHKDPDQRYPNATDLSRVLRRLERAQEPESSAGHEARNILLARMAHAMSASLVRRAALTQDAGTTPLTPAVSTRAPAFPEVSTPGSAPKGRGDTGKARETTVLPEHQRAWEAAVADVSWRVGKNVADALCTLAVLSLALVSWRLSWFQASGPGGFVDLGVIPNGDRQFSPAALAGALLVVGAAWLVAPDLRSDAASFQKGHAWTGALLAVAGVFVAALGELEAQHAAGVENSGVRDMAGFWLCMGAAGAVLLAAIAVLMGRRAALTTPRTY